MGTPNLPINLPGDLATFIGNAKALAKRQGVAYNPQPLNIPPALSMGATTPLGGRPSNLLEGVLANARSSTAPVGNSGINWDPEALIKGVEAQSQANELQAMGQDSSPHHESLMQHAFDWLGRPLNALTGGIENEVVNRDNAHGGGVLSGLGGFFTGALGGLEGKGPYAHQDWGDVANLLSNKNNSLVNATHATNDQQLTYDMQNNARDGGGWQHGLGFAGDLVLDPLNLVGIGEAKNALKLARTVEDVNGARKFITVAGRNTIPLPKMAEVGTGISKLFPGERGAKLAEVLGGPKGTFSSLATPMEGKDLLNNLPINRGFDISGKLIKGGKLDEETANAMGDAYRERLNGIRRLQVAHPVLTDISKMFTAPSKMMGKVGNFFLQGHGLDLAQHAEIARQLHALFHGVNDVDKTRLLEEYRTGGDSLMHNGATVLNKYGKNIAPEFADRVNQARLLAKDYLDKGGSISGLQRKLQYVGGPELTEQAIKDPAGWQSWVGQAAAKDAHSLLGQLHNGINLARGQKDIADVIKEKHGYRLPQATRGVSKGKTIVGATNEVGKKKLAEGWAPINHPQFMKNGVPTHIFPPEISHQTETLFHLLDSPNVRSAGGLDLLRKFDKATNEYKKLVTIYNPGAHSRYGMSQMLQMFMNGFRDPRNFKYAFRTMFAHDPEARNIFRVSANHPDLDLLRHPGYENAAKGKGFNVKYSKRLGRNLTDQEIWNDSSRLGFNHTFANSQIEAGTGRLSKLNNTLLNVGQKRDMFARMAHYLDALERAPKGLPEEEAKKWAGHQVVRTFHNFADLSKFERNVMQRLMPFYADIRKNMPMLLKSIVQHPGRVAAYPLALQELEEGTGGINQTHDPLYQWLTPDYLFSSGAVPVGKHGDNPVFLNQKNHLSDLLYQLGGQPLSGNPLNMTGQEGKFLARQFGLATANPLFRIPIELGMGKQAYSGNPINSNTRYLAQQLPFLNTPYKIWENQQKGQGQVDPGNPLLSPAIINWLTGLGLIENSPTQQQAAVNSRSVPMKKELKKLLPSSVVP